MQDLPMENQEDRLDVYEIELTDPLSDLSQEARTSSQTNEDEYKEKIDRLRVV